MLSHALFLHLLLDRFILWTNAELFSALCELETLLDAHKRVANDLDYYIDKEEQRLQSLKRHLHIYKTEHQKAMEDVPNYFGNPINAFKLIKRLTTDLDHIEDCVTTEKEKTNEFTLRHINCKYPVVEDLAGAALALVRLQEVYNLRAGDISVGILNGVDHNTQMSAGDCYELGRALYNEKDFKHALPWMEQALRKLKDSDDPRPLSEADILEYISFLHYLLGDSRSGHDWSKRLLKVSPKQTRARGDTLNNQQIIAQESTKLLTRLGDSAVQRHRQTRSKTQETLTYEALCRGEMAIPTEISKSLHCRYLHEHHPFLRLAPIKMELVYSQPDVVVFHEVLSHEEIKLIKDIAKPRLKRSKVTNPASGELVPADIRISKSSWLRDEESPVLARVSQRVSDMTGLSMLIAEELLVVNYGIGGHYNPHFDFARKNEFAFKTHQGNRIATVLFYMSDIAQGGATVFTELGLSVSPIKGTAVFWMNLHPSGEGDFATRHAACPVLYGSKWVCNKWIHQGGQELLKPCNLQYQPEGIMRPVHIT